MAKQEYGARKQAILAIIKARPGISSTDVRTAYDAQTGKDSGKSTVSSSLTELHGAGDVRREKVLSDNCGYFYRYWLTTSPVAAAPVPAVASVQAGKPAHMKPFNLGHARAGAPFCCRDGVEVDILKWDRKHTFCIVGLDTLDASVRRWRADGSYDEGFNVFDLVMLPLGFIDGKPVWVGDELADVEDSTRRYTVEPHQNNFAGCRWPAPAPVYPFTRMSSPELTEVFDANLMLIVALENVANAALRHAIDAGQVVLPNGDGMAAELVRAQEAAAKTGEMLARDAARDLAVAQAVVAAVVETVAPMKMPAIGRSVQRLDLAAIIAGVAK